MNKQLHWGNFKTPARPVRSTRKDRLEEHKVRMIKRRRVQQARSPSSQGA